MGVPNTFIHHSLSWCYFSYYLLGCFPGSLHKNLSCIVMQNLVTLKSDDECIGASKIVPERPFPSMDSLKL